MPVELRGMMSPELLAKIRAKEVWKYVGKTGIFNFVDAKSDEINFLHYDTIRSVFFCRLVCIRKMTANIFCHKISELTNI